MSRRIVKGSQTKEWILGALMRSDQKNRGENTLYRGKGKKGNLDCTAFHLTALEDGHFGRLLFAKRLVDLSPDRPAD
jgi:hypothetical protein